MNAFIDLTTVTLDDSLGEVLAALDAACAAVDAAASPPSGLQSGDEDLAELLVTIRLEMTVARARLSVDAATDLPGLVAAIELVATSAEVWLDDEVIRARLGAMRPRDRATSVTCRIAGTATEMRRIAAEIRDTDDLAGARSRARRSVQLARVALEHAALSVRHAG